MENTAIDPRPQRPSGVDSGSGFQRKDNLEESDWGQRTRLEKEI